MLFWPLNPIYTQIPNSPTSIIWGQTNFPSSLTTISGFLNRCFFDLSTRFVLKFRLPDLDYPRFDQVLTIIGQYYKFLQQMFFDLWTQEWLIFGLPDLENLRSDQVPTIIGHYKWVLKSMFFWPRCKQTNKQTNKRIFFIWPSLQSRE